MTTLDISQPILRFRRYNSGLLVWLSILALTLGCLAISGRVPWISSYPADWTLPVSVWVNTISDYAVAVSLPFFRGITSWLDGPMRGVQAALQWLPWPVTILLVAAIALRASGWSLAAFSVSALLYMLLVGYWRQSMNTVALVFLSVPLSVVAGLLIGVIIYYWRQVRTVAEITMDFMQTVPTFAYLIPLLLLFGFGPVVGLISSAIYAIPPMVRNTYLGLERVPSDLKDAGLMSGCTRWQQFWYVKIPTALPQLLVGTNQTTMAALSMVIIAAIIGGSDDIGWEVLASMRKANFGQSLLSGLTIALLAMLIDRITVGFARSARSRQASSRLHGSALIILTLVGGLSYAVLLRWFESGYDASAPAAKGLAVAHMLNEGVLCFIRNFSEVLDIFKNVVLVYVMLPLRIGLIEAISPFLWGFSLTLPVILSYILLLLLISSLLAVRFSWRPGIAVLVGGVFLFFGFAKFPWPAFITIFGTLAFYIGGWRIAVFALGTMMFILVTGLWEPFMLSVYVCGLAVFLSIVLGGGLGVMAAHNDRLSAILRPVNDALQTMPQFVFLIPAVMFFKAGEFTALIAVILYSIVPPIRYVEHGLRNVQPDCVEAARQIGCTPQQLLWQVKLPLALPVILLGLNQTILAALSMLTIAATVGTKDLGQQVYIALGKADAGLGLVAGVCIALVAMVADRAIRAWCQRSAFSTGTGAQL